MARNKSGAFNRLLNVIGLVDDEHTRDTSGEEYQNGNYGRQGAYPPARPSSRPSERTRQQSQRRSLPEPRASRYGERQERRSARQDYDDYGAAERRQTSRFQDAGYEDDYMPRSDRGSRFSEQPERSAAVSVPQRAPRP